MSGAAFPALRVPGCGIGGHVTPRLKKEMFAGIRRPKALTGIVDRVVEAKASEEQAQ